MEVACPPLQSIWSYGINNFNDQLCSPAFPTLLAVAVYFFANIPFMAIDLAALDWSQAYKIQPQPVVTWAVMCNAIVMNFWNQVLYLIPATLLHIYVQGKEELPLEAPTLFQLCYEVVACFLLFDTVYFFWHLLHHKVRLLYDLIHSTHHEYHAPFSWVAQHVHPLELIETGCIAIGLPKLMGCHPFSTWVWLIILTLLRIETHCGYSFPFQFANWIPFGVYGGSIAHDHHHQQPECNFQPFLTYWDRLFGFYHVPTHPHLGILPHDDHAPATEEDVRPSYLFQMFLLPDVIVRWFDIEYQARCYALLHTARPHLIHVVSFMAFITAFFAVTAALNNLTKNVTLLLVSLFLCGAFYEPHRFRLLVVLSLFLFWFAGHALVSIFGAHVVKQCYVIVVTASVMINMLGHLNSDLFWGCPGAFQRGGFEGVQRSPEARLAIILPHIILRLPFAVLQAFLAPFRLFPAVLWLWWFADIDAVERAAACGRRNGLESEVTFRHVLRAPFRGVADRMIQLGLPGAALVRSDSFAALTAFFSHSVPALVQLWFLTDICLLCHEVVTQR